MSFRARVQRFLFGTALILSMAGAFVALPGFAATASAQGVSIHPKRVVLEGRERSASVELINRGDTTVTYRLAFQRVRVDADGKRETVEEAHPGERFSDEYIRFSPRQVTLRPGESQRVRLMARKPADLEDGEYRSHLLFQALPAVRQTNSSGRGDPTDDANGLSVSIEMRTNLSIPVIVRHGELNAAVKFSSVEFDQESGPALNFVLERNGQRSVYGDFEVTFVADTGEVVPLARNRGVAVYSPNSKRNFRLPLRVPEELLLEDGELSIRFAEEGRRGVRAEWSDVLRMGNDSR